MAETTRCPRCGLELEPDAPAGLCPKCLLSPAALEAPVSGFDATVGSVAPASESEQTTDRSPRTALGTRIGPYKLLQELGEGGMGTVYMAEQEKPVRRKVALKVIKPGMDSQEVLARFEAERQALALMEHPNIARVFDAGTTENGRPYFVMELVKGVPITKYCDEHSLSPRERLELFVPVCQAIQHAHQKGIIHRDIKPSNVLVASYDGHPAPKVIDFGVAKATGQQLTEKTLFTAFGGIVGTLEYMSPEQAAFNALDIDTRSDVYALGVLLYELLTGSPPLTRQRLKETAIMEALRLIREEEAEKPSTRLSSSEGLPSLAALRKTEPARLTKQMRGEVDWIAMKALEKDRARRYETASGFARDIERYLRDEPVEAGPPSASYRLRKLARRYRNPLRVAAAFAVLLVGATVFSAWQAVIATQAQHAAEAAENTAQNEKTIADEERTRASTARDVALTANKDKDRALHDLRSQLVESLSYQGSGLLDAGRSQEAFQVFRRAWPLLADSDRPELWIAAPLLALYSQYSPPLSAPTAFLGHKSLTRGVAITPDGRVAVSASADQTLKVWDVLNGREVRTLTGHLGPVNGVAMSPDGRSALSASSDKTLKLWDLSTGKAIRTLSGHSAEVNRVAFSPDGLSALSASTDQTLKLWDLDTGKEIRTLSGHAGRVSCVAISPDGRKAVSGGALGRNIDRDVLVWDLATGALLHRIRRAHENDVYGVAVCPDGRRILSAGAGTIRLWDLDNGSAISSFQGGDLISIALSPDGRTALTGHSDSLIKLWDLDSGKELRTFAGPKASALSVAFTPDGRFGLSAHREGALVLWDLGASQEIPSLPSNRGQVSGVAISPDNRLALAGGQDATVKVWDLETGKEIRTFAGPNTNALSVAFTPDGRTVVTATEKMLKVWDLSTGNTMGEMKGHSAQVTSVALSPDGKTALSGSRDATLKLWDLATGTEIRTLTGHSDWVNSVAIAPDGHTAVSGSRDKALKIWDLHSGKEIRSDGFSASVESVAIASDGRTAVLGSYDQTLKVWDLLTGKEIRTLAGHSGIVIAVAVSPDGRTALSASVDKTIRLWDLTTGSEIRGFSSGSSVYAVYAVSISGDGRRAVSSGSMHDLRVWDFSGPGRYFQFEELLRASAKKLDATGNDTAFWSALGQWYAFRHVDDWAVECFEKARAAGGNVEPLALGRCYWRLNKLTEAHREFQAALVLASALSEREYLKMCLDAIDRPPPPPSATRATPATSTAAATNPADALARKGDFPAAAKTIVTQLTPAGSITPSPPTDSLVMVQFLALLAETGEEEAYRQSCHALLEQNAQTTNIVTARRLSKACLLLPLSETDTQQAAAMADRALAGSTAVNDRVQAQLGKALAELRLGRYSEAIDFAQKVIDAGQQTGRPTFSKAGEAAAAYAVQSIAHRSLGHSDEAAAALAKASLAMSEVWPTPSRTDLGELWRDVVIAHVLVREAEAAMK